MRYATVEFSDNGTMTDPRPYLEWLDAHADELPPGARAFGRLARGSRSAESSRSRRRRRRGNRLLTERAAT